MPVQPTPTRIFQPASVGVMQSIHDVKYATRTIAAGVIPAQTNFFGAAPSADATVDRYDQGNTLVSSGKIFTIRQIGLVLIAGAAAVLTDFEKIINYCALRIVASSKEFGVIPVINLPAGGGLNALGGQVAVTPAASPGAFSVVGTGNGHPMRKRFALQCPLELQANQAFYCELIAPTATTQTLAGAIICRLELEGVEQRPAA